MEPERQNNPFPIFMDGVPISGLADLPDISVPDSAAAPMDEHFSITTASELAVNIEIPKELRCKTRKRFIKLLMSKGYSRNISNKMAAIILDTRGLVSYQKAWWLLS